MTLIRKPADPFRADVLRGDRSPFEGEVITTPEPDDDPWAEYRDLDELELRALAGDR